LRTSERRELRAALGSKIGKLNGVGRKLHKEELEGKVRNWKVR
jgi:hypothetical protein